MKKVLRILAYVLLSAVALLGILAGATQTAFFRDRLRSFALAELDSVFDAEVRIGAINGNLVTGFSIDSVAFLEDGRPVIDVARIDLQYDLFDIPGRRVSVRNLVLVHPRLFLTRGLDSAWNLSRLLRPTPEDTTRTPFDWPVNLQRLEIEGGLLAVTDSLALRAQPPLDSLRAHAHTFTVRDFNLLLSARLSPEAKHLTIYRLSAVDETKHLTVRNLALDVTVTPTEAVVQYLDLRTERSHLLLAASMQHLNLLGGVALPRLERCPTSVKLEGAPIDLNELQSLLPPLEFLNGAATLELNASGEFGRLNIARLDLRTGHSTMQWKGTISNLHRPRDLALDVRLTDGAIHPGDLLTLMPPFQLPDFSHLGMTRLALDFTGRPLDFRTHIALSTSGGDADATVALAIGGESTLRYRAEVTGRNVDLARVLNTPAFESTLNGSATIEGEGVDLDHLASVADVKLEPSTFRGLPVPASQVHLESRDRVLSGGGAIGLGEMRAMLTGTLDRRDLSAPRFTVDGSVNAVNLGTILRNPEYDSDLTMRLHANGSGNSWSTLQGDLQSDFSSSRYKGYRLDSGNVAVELDQSDSLHRRLEINSNIADFSLTGAFNLETLLHLVGFEVQNLRRAIGDKLARLDSALVPTLDLVALARDRETVLHARDTVDARYTLRMKNLEPVSVVAGEQRFQGEGVLQGSLHGTSTDMTLEGMLDAQYFFYGTVNRGVLLQDATIAFNLADLTPENPLRAARLTIGAKARKVLWNHTTFDSVGVDVRFADEFARYAVRTINPGRISLDMRGTAAVTDAGIAAVVNGLSVSHDEFSWVADSGATLNVTRAEATLRDLRLRHDTAVVDIAARIAAGDSLRITATGRSLGLSDLRYVLGTGEARGHGDVFTGSADLDARIQGTPEAPVITVAVHGRDIAFRQVPFGRLEVTGVYRDSSLALSVQGGVYADSTVAPLRITGSFPMYLGTASIDERILERPMHLSVASTGTQMSILDPLLPTFNDLTGTMRCAVEVGGTPRNPRYSGSMTFEGCEFLFVPNNIRYTMSASFIPLGDRIQVTDATIRNIAADQRAGRRGELHIKGDFAFRDFRPGDFHLTAEGALQVIKENSRLSSLALSGNLYTEIEDGGLQFTGNIEDSRLKGSLLVSNSDLVFPPTQVTTEEDSPLSVPYVVVNDTMHAAAASAPAALAQFFANDSLGTQAGVNADTSSGRSFLDGVHYDLDIETSGGNTQIRMIFNAITNEELLANIEGKFSVTGDGRQWFGDLTVTRAYYNFFKRFNAVGTLSYRGDVMNPGLDIKATYEGQRTTTDSTGRSLTDNVVVTFKITGTRFEPKADVSMTINGEEYNQYSTKHVTSNDVQTDAIQFIVYGSFPLTAAQRSDAGNDLRATVGGSLLTSATSLLTNSLSEILRAQTGIVDKVGVTFDKGSADIRLGGTALNGVWQYGGKILDSPLNNANFSILYSFGTIFNKPSLRNLMFELERKVETNTLSPTNELKATSSARLFYRFSF